MAIFQIIYTAHWNNLNIYIYLLGNSKKEASVPSNNDSYYIGITMLIAII